MTNIQGNLFEMPQDETSQILKPADKARLELTPEAAEKRRLEKKARDRRIAEAIQRRQDQIDRAREQGLDLRTHEEIRLASAKRGLEKARERLNKTTPHSEVDN
jgi:hypothetical protein